MTDREPKVPPPGTDIEVSRTAIRDLIDLWPRLVGTSGAPFREDLDLRRAIGIHTHAHHAVQLARALVVMDEAGAGHEMVPTIRAIFEMAVTSAWLLLTPGSGESFVKTGAQKRKTAAEYLLRLGHEADPALSQANATLKELEDARSVTIERQCEALYDGRSLYMTYRALSSEAHSGLGIADAYFVETASSEIGVAFDPSTTLTPRDAYIGISAALLLLAVNADETARAKPRFTTQLRNIARRLNVSYRISRADGSTLPDRRSK